MKKKKLLKTGLAVALAVMTLAQPVSTANWVGNNTGWWWQEDNGSYPTNQWKAINGKWYWFDGNGYMVTGWRNINGTWYYLESSGAMASNKWIGNYYVESSGAMATNKWIGNYYVNGDGLWTQTKTTGQWISSGNRWWYRHFNGSYALGWEKIDGNYYLFDNSGWMLIGWQFVNGSWYYMNNSGAMLTGWQYINGTWYYMNSSGAMLTEWQCIGGKWYYFYSDGSMASNIWIDGTYYVESSGAMATNKWIDDYFYVDSTGRLVEIAGDGHHWNDGIITTEPTSILEGVKTYTCIYCGATKTEPVRPLDHNWVNFEWPDFKNGYACNICYNDVTDYDDYYDCHGGWHTHTFYNFPSYYSCDSCDKLIHKHKWYYTPPEFFEGTDVISSEGYWECNGCGNQSSDGKHTEPILVSDAGHEYGAIDHWTTPFNFEKDSHDWVIVDEYWAPANDELHLHHIRINGVRSMAVGDTYQETVQFTPAHPLEGTDVSWESSDPSVIAVDSTGKVTALKIGTATIKATSSKSTDTFVIRVTENNVGHVDSASLLIDGQSNPSGVLELKRGSYSLSVQTNPEQAVYEVYYQTEEDSSKGLIANITGSIRMGDISIYGWANKVRYTDPSSSIDFLRKGSVLLKATITDVNGDRIELEQQIIVE